MIKVIITDRNNNNNINIFIRIANDYNHYAREFEYSIYGNSSTLIMEISIPSSGIGRFA